EAAVFAQDLADQWSNQTAPMREVWTGPDQPLWDEEALVTQALDGGPPYWGETKEVEVYQARERRDADAKGESSDD
ncbi:MAG: hypothetical protein IIB99_06625, partial [Planctomycetes bacterium]|nr:hypothetical protein [Planctomycetota bacterium]